MPILQGAVMIKCCQAPRSVPGTKEYNNKWQVLPSTIYPSPYLLGPATILSSHISPLHFTTPTPPPLQRPPETAVSMVISVLISLEFNVP